MCKETSFFFLSISLPLVLLPATHLVEVTGRNISSRTVSHRTLARSEQALINTRCFQWRRKVPAVSDGKCAWTTLGQTPDSTGIWGLCSQTSSFPSFCLVPLISTASCAPSQQCRRLKAKLWFSYSLPNEGLLCTHTHTSLQQRASYWRLLGTSLKAI